MCHLVSSHNIPSQDRSQKDIAPLKEAKRCGIDHKTGIRGENGTQGVADSNHEERDLIKIQSVDFWVVGHPAEEETSKGGCNGHDADEKCCFEWVDAFFNGKAYLEKVWKKCY